ncbi:MAG: hypothetical protein CME62_14015 [Halobacteriovoraceae bacterium]|nr:hypothetical protein [Halobacteriovoraceae bacterium]|tara:strand:+ start:6660 stop:7223 length:564 start_codon:yes stop_codon:yes gene_type:complete
MSALRIILISLILIASQAFAGKLGVEIGTGYKSPYGSLGIGIRYFPIRQLDFHYTGGVGVIGSLSTLGTRIYTKPIGNRCLLFIPCKPLYYIGLSYGQSNGGEVDFEEDDEKSQYDFSRGEFYGLNIGAVSLFGEVFYYTFDLGYRSFVKSPTYELASGPGDSDATETFDQYIASGLNLSFNLGFMF